MKKVIIYIITGVILITTHWYCSEEFLDQKPYDSYSEVSVLNDLTLTEMFLRMKYRHAFEYFAWILAYSGMCDEGYSNWFYFNENDIVKGGMTGDGDYRLVNEWDNKFGDIRDLNSIINNIDNAEGEEYLRNRLKGEAVFLRAYIYFDLIRKWGGVPIIKTQLDPYGDLSNIKRNTYDECVRFIIDDLDGIVDYLPYEYDDDNLGKITKGATLALKSRVLLYWASPRNNPGNDMSRWTEASAAAKAVIDLKDEKGNTVYSLYNTTDYANIFIVDFNSEIILPRMQSNDYIDENNLDLLLSPNGYYGWSAYVPIQGMIDEYEMANGLGINEPGSGYNPNNPYSGREKRFYSTILYNGAQYKGRAVECWVTKDENGEVANGGLDSQASPIEDWNYSKTSYNIRKYTLEDEIVSEDDGSPVKPVVFRLAEMYLNYAEAEYMLGNETVAREYINYIRERPCVGLPAIQSSVTGDDLLEKIRHERMIELVFEGHRYFDIRRWGIMVEMSSKDAYRMEVLATFDTTVVDTTYVVDTTFSYNTYLLEERTFYEKDYLWPIPYSELLKIDLEQNPGY